MSKNSIPEQSNSNNHQNDVARTEADCNFHFIASYTADWRTASEARENKHFAMTFVEKVVAVTRRFGVRSGDKAIIFGGEKRICSDLAIRL